MEENAQGAVELNSVQQEQNELENAKRELYEVKSKLASLNLPDGFKVVSIGKYSKLKVSERIEESDVIELELENEEQERQTQLYKELEDKRLLLIGVINEKEQIVLAEEYKQLTGERYKGFISREELDRAYDVNKDEMQKDAEINLEEEPEQEIEENETGKSSDELEIAAKLGIPPSQIVNVVEVKDEEAMSNTLNKNLENKTLYAVRLKTHAGRFTNEWVMMQKDSNGKFERGMREDASDTLNEIGHELGLNKNIPYNTIEDGEITAEADPFGKRHVEIRRHRFTDGNTYVLEVDKTYESVLHVYKEEDGKLTPLCIEEHGEHEAETIVLKDRIEALEVQEEKDEEKKLKKQQEEEDKTPGGDAYNRLHYRDHN